MQVFVAVAAREMSPEDGARLMMEGRIPMLKRLMIAVWTFVRSLNRSKLVHAGMFLGAVVLPALIAWKADLTAGTVVEMYVGTAIGILTRFNFFFQKVVPLLDGSQVIQVKPPGAGEVPSLAAVAVNPSAVLPPTPVERDPQKGGFVVDSILVVGIVTTIAAVAVALIFALPGCAGPQPVPTPPPTPDPVADAFTGVVVDCSLAAVPAPLDDARTCLDLANTDTCLMGMLVIHTPDTVACSVRSLSMAAHVLVAKGVANEQIIGEVRAADAWIRTKQIGYR
jgi:hypothetical protein